MGGRDGLGKSRPDGEDGAGRDVVAPVRLNIDDYLAQAMRDMSTDRAMGALAGVALGDALGMPSQTLTQDQIRHSYGTIDDFVTPFADHPVSHGLMAAMVTDDTEQTMLLARQIIRNSDGFDDDAWAQTLLGWEHDMRARGLRDLLGPSTRAALAALAAGVPVDRSGRGGTTNGAAMRIIPVGIATPASDLSKLVDRVVEVSRLTHNTGEAIAAAAAVAAVISQGVAGATFDEALPQALAAAVIGNQRGAQVGETAMTDRIERALGRTSAQDLAQAVGTSVASRESVAAAFGVVRLAAGNPWQAAMIAANIGDDTDTIGAIATGMAAACCGYTGLPQDKVRRVLGTNGLELPLTVERLLDIRRRRMAAAECAAS
jgi:ADP-ribosylglycohydrolase